MEYNAKIEEMEKILAQQQPVLKAMTEMANEIKAVKLTIPEPKVGAANPQLKDALAKAKQITEEKGITSPEAKVAWDAVEEIAASSSNDNAMGVMLTDECLVEAAREACEAIEELNRVLNLTKAGASRYSG